MLTEVFIKTVRIAESGALERLGKFYHNRQAALADRLQQVLDSLNPQPVTQGGQTWEAPEGMGAGNFTVTPAPSQPGKELVFVQDDEGMEVLVDPMIAVPALQKIPLDQITSEAVWNVLNDASAESDQNQMLFSPRYTDQDAESAWDQAISAHVKRAAAIRQRNVRADVSSDTWNTFERLKEIMGETLLLEELVHAMSDSEAVENFKFIIRMHDLSDEFETEDEEGGDFEDEGSEEEPPPSTPPML